MKTNAQSAGRISGKVGVSLFLFLTLILPATAQLAQLPSTIDGISTIADTAIYKELNPNGTVWHCYEYTPQLDTKASPYEFDKSVLSPQGVEVLAVKIIDIPTIQYSSFTERVPTTKEDGTTEYIDMGSTYPIYSVSKTEQLFKKDGQSKAMCFLTEFGAKGKINPNITACNYTASTPGTYNQTANLTCTGTHGVIISGNDIIFDCQGNWMVGDGTASTYGIYITGDNVSVRNCEVANFDVEYRLINSANSDINNSIGNTTGGSFALYSTGVGTNLVINNSLFQGGTTYQLRIDGATGAIINNTNTSGTNGILVNSEGTITDNFNASCSFICWIGYDAKIQNSYLSGGATYGLYVSGTGEANNLTVVGGATVIGNATISNIDFTALGAGATTGTTFRSESSGVRMTNATYDGYYRSVVIDTTYATLTNITIRNHFSSGNAFEIAANRHNNTIQNSTIEDGNRGFLLSSGAADNYILRNNITADTWADDSGTNFYNTSDYGNIYYFSNGTASWDVFDLTASSGNWADAGADWPFNETTTLGNITGTATDYRPYTNVSSATPTIQDIQILPASPTELDTLQCQVNATYEDSSSFDIEWEWYVNDTINATGTYSGYSNGTLTNVSNITAGNLTAGQNWTCSARGIYGAITGNWSNSSTVNISAASLEANVSITYPAPGTYGVWANDCHQIVEIETTDNAAPGASRSATCYFYSALSTTNPNYTLIQTLTGDVNGTYNFTVPISSNTSFAVNCSATVDVLTVYSNTTEMTLIGTSFCSGGEEDTTPGMIFLGTILLGFAFIYLGVEGYDV